MTFELLLCRVRGITGDTLCLYGLKMKKQQQQQVAGFIISHYRYGTGEGLTRLLHMTSYVSVAWYSVQDIDCCHMVRAHVSV